MIDFRKHSCLPQSFLFLAIVLGSVSAALAAPSACPASPADEAKVVETVRAVFAAASADDLDKFHSVTTSDFYAYDAGMRFDGDALMKLVKADHAKGRIYVWTVTKQDVHVSCDVAWIAYVNEGSITDGAKTTKITWLESAFLQKDAGVWKIHFVHSTRASEMR